MDVDCHSRGCKKNRQTNCGRWLLWLALPNAQATNNLVSCGPGRSGGRNILRCGCRQLWQKQWAGSGPSASLTARPSNSLITPDRGQGNPISNRLES